MLLVSRYFQHQDVRVFVSWDISLGKIGRVVAGKDSEMTAWLVCSEFCNETSCGTSAKESAVLHYFWNSLPSSSTP